MIAAAEIDIMVQSPGAPDFTLTWAGWLVMIISVGTIAALFLWCIWRVLRYESSPNKLESQVTIEPEEEGEDPFQPR